MDVAGRCYHCIVDTEGTGGGFLGDGTGCRVCVWVWVCVTSRRGSGVQSHRWSGRLSNSLVDSSPVGAAD